MTSHPRLLVTGAGGSIGRRVRARLDAEGYDASYLYSPRSAAKSSDPSVDIVDITDSARVAEIIALRRPTAIIHLASITGAACDTDPQLAEAVNVEAVRSMVDIAQTGGVSKFVLASTAAVYGDGYDSPAVEDGQIVLESRYAATKRQAELVLAAAAKGPAEFSAVALRIFNVFGPGMGGSLANRLIAAEADSVVSLAGLDTFIRDYVHVDDVVDALILAAESPLSAEWSVFNVASGRPTSNRDLVDALKPVFFTIAEARASYSCADVTQARQHLGFVARQELSRSSVTQ